MPYQAMGKGWASKENPLRWAVTFDTNITLKSNIALGFRVLVNNPRSKKPADQLPLADDDPTNQLTIYIAAVVTPALVEERGSPRIIQRVRRDLETRTSGVLTAILYVIQSNPPTQLVSKLTIGLPQIEDIGWTGEKDKVLLMSIVALLRARANRSTFRVTDNKDDNTIFKSAKALADIALNGDPTEEYIVDPEDISTEIPSRYQLQGISLANTSQAIFYAVIRAEHVPPERLKTTVMLDMTRYAVQDQCGKIPTDEDIWKSIRHKDIDRRVCNFLWRSLHQSYKCGPYWRNIPTFEHWAVCSTCDVDETMEHVMFECSAPDNSGK
ncbi:hypothetical protein B0H13DRAFT_1856482 [Mycena leptocephala]|nr:hypothetical protein B0H13DRAFT_1856482 [Mycena leptocephala]